jgi:hypothetical protein
MDLKEKFLMLAKQLEEQIDALNKTREELTQTMTELQIGTYIQDPDTLAVYKIVEPNGTFTYYRKIDYKRTALEGEKGGNPLSKKEALEVGFILK